MYNIEIKIEFGKHYTIKRNDADGPKCRLSIMFHKVTLHAPVATYIMFSSTVVRVGMSLLTSLGWETDEVVRDLWHGNGHFELGSTVTVVCALFIAAVLSLV